MHWIAGEPPGRGRRLTAKTRYRMKDAACRIEPLEVERWRASFDTPQWAPTPGQYLVIYDGEACLGGAVITASVREDAIAAPDAATAPATS
jgi:tRNA-specific 2-thiouridylase